MQNREVTVALCGAIVGVMVGAGTFVVARDTVLDASLFTAYRNLMNTQVMPRTDALRRPESTTELKQASSSSAVSSAPAPVVEAEPVECTTGKKLSAEFLDAIDRFLPLNQRNMEAREKLRAVAESMVGKYCTAAPTHAAPPEAAPQAQVDNHCEQYGVRTSRYIVCTAEEAAGRVYP